MRRPAVRLAALAALAALCLAVPATAARPAASWAEPQIRAVLSAGLLAPDRASFRPDDPLTRGELAELVAGLTATVQPVPTAPAAPVTIAELHSRLVHALGLGDAAWSIRRAARDAGLAPPSRLGTEVVARLLGLRRNHPAGEDALERHPNEPASRAEAAYTAARVLELSGRRIESARAAAATFALPELSAWQRRVLTRALSLVGLPYVWGGEDELTERGLDCSGFVWRVYKTRPFPGGEALAKTLRGRTTYALSAEVKEARRIGFDAVAPGDVLFFGAAGPRSRPAQVDHAGVLVARGWMVHSSRDGVTLTPVEGWYRERFAWARRPLAEARLETQHAPA